MNTVFSSQLYCIFNLVSEDSNFEIVGEAADGLEAVACVEKLMPDLLLMGLSMTTMPGFEAIKEIKNDITQPGVLH